jgi:hypothetical protein
LHYRLAGQRDHQRGDLTHVAGILDGALGVFERRLGIAEEPESPRSESQNVHLSVVAKTHCQLTMLGRIIKRERPIEMRSRFDEVPRPQQGKTHKAMPYHKGNRGFLFLGERQEMGHEIATRIGVPREGRVIEAVEDREQQQRIFGRLSQRLRLFDQQACPLRDRLGRRIPFDQGERDYQRDLKLDLFAPQRGSGRQGLDLVDGTRELLYGFNQRRALERPLSCLAPQACRFLDQPGLSAVPGQQLRLALGNVRELALEDVGDAGVQRTSLVAQ